MTIIQSLVQVTSWCRLARSHYIKKSFIFNSAISIVWYKFAIHELSDALKLQPRSVDVIPQGCYVGGVSKGCPLTVGSRQVAMTGWCRVKRHPCLIHCNDVIMGTMAPQITSPTIVYQTVHSGADQKKTSKLCVTGLCVGNSPVIGELTAQMASNAENATIDDVIVLHVFYCFIWNDLHTLSLCLILVIVP